MEVRELELMAWDPPDARFRATVSAGTYLRSLARDVGEALGCGGHLVALTRTRVGSFRLAEAIAPAAVTAAQARDPAVLVAGLARRDLDATERDAVVHGRPVPVGSGNRETREDSLTVAGNVALFHSDALVAVAEVQGDVLKPRVVVAEE